MGPISGVAFLFFVFRILINLYMYMAIILDYYIFVEDVCRLAGSVNTMGPACFGRGFNPRPDFCLIKTKFKI